MQAAVKPKRSGVKASTVLIYIFFVIFCSAEIFITIFFNSQSIDYTDKITCFLKGKK